MTVESLHNPSSEVPQYTVHIMQLWLLGFKFAAFVVLIRAEGLATTGERYQLTCSVTMKNGSSPMIMWTNSDEVIISNSSGIFLGPQVTNGTTSTVLQFYPLSTVHQGNYTCQASLGEETFSYSYLVMVTASE